MIETILWRRAYEKVDPLRINEYFQRGENFPGNLAELLLQNESTALFHVDSTRLAYLGNPNDPIETFMEPLLLGVNYHKGHSEGNHKIIIQNIPKRKGPYVLFRPPGSEENSFYLQDVVLPIAIPPIFQENVANPLKINQFYLYRGDPLKIFEDFQKLGFRFVEEPMYEDHYERLSDLSFQAMERLK